MMITGTMQAATTAQDDYSFVAAEKDGLFCLLLVDGEMLAAPPPFMPLFVWTFDHADQRDAAATWLEARCDRWPAWGRMARVGGNLLNEHLTATIKAEPLPPLAWGCSVDADPVETRSVTLYELFDGPGHPGKVAVWQTTYATAVACRRVLRWLMRTDVIPAWQALARLSRTEGPDAVTEVVLANVARNDGKKRWRR